MTTVMETPVRPSVTAAAAPARFRDLLASEWIKLWSLRSTSWAFALTAIAVVGINVDAAMADYHNYPTYSANIKAGFVPYWAINDAFTNNAVLILMVVTGAMGANILVSEHSTGLIRTTFAAVPARRAVAAAKVLVATVVFLAFGAFVAATSFGVTQAILSGRHAGLSISYPGAFRVVAVSALLSPLCALVGMGIGALIRHSATTMVSTVIVQLLLPFIFASDRRWSSDIRNAMPYTAWQRLTSIASDFGVNPLRATVTGSWVVYAVWPLAAAIVTLVMLDRRDV